MGKIHLNIKRPPANFKGCLKQGPHGAQHIVLYEILGGSFVYNTLLVLKLCFKYTFYSSTVFRMSDIIQNFDYRWISGHIST